MDTHDNSFQLVNFTIKLLEQQQHYYKITRTTTTLSSNNRPNFLSIYLSAVCQVLILSDTKQLIYNNKNKYFWCTKEVSLLYDFLKWLLKNLFQKQKNVQKGGISSLINTPICFDSFVMKSHTYRCKNDYNKFLWFKVLLMKFQIWKAKFLGYDLS